MGNSSCKKDRYEEGAPICIDSIGLCYDYIGLQDEVPSVEGGQIAVKYDALPKLFTSVEGTEFNHPNGETLYKPFTFAFLSLADNLCCSLSTDTALKSFLHGISIMLLSSQLKNSH